MNLGAGKRDLRQSLRQSNGHKSIMSRTEQLVEDLRAATDPTFWSAIQRDIIESETQRRWADSRQILRNSYRCGSPLTVAEAARQAHKHSAIAANARKAALAKLDRYSSIRRQLLETEPDLLGGLRPVDMSNARQIDPDRMAQIVSTVLRAVLQREAEKWSPPQSPSDWAAQFDIHVNTLKRYVEAGLLRIDEITTKLWRAHVDDERRLTPRA